MKFGDVVSETYNSRRLTCIMILPQPGYDLSPYGVLLHDERGNMPVGEKTVIDGEDIKILESIDDLW